MKLGIIGTGRVAQVHAEAFRQIEPDLIGGAWNRTYSKAQEFCGVNGGQAYESLDDLLGASDIDAVVITSSTPTHFDIAKSALQAGKHVLLEKPVCETPEQIATLAKIAEEAGRICMPSHNYLYSEDVRRLRYHAHSGNLGHILNFWVMFNNAHPPHYGMTDTYMMRELFVHHIYVLLSVMGRPKSVSVTGSNTHFEDPSAIDQMGIAAMYEGGQIANLWGSFATDDHSRESWSYLVKVMGTEGTGVATWDKIKYGVPTEPLWDDGGYWDSFLHVDKYFVDECLARGKAPLSTLADARDAALIFDAAVLSLNERRHVDVKYPD
ncbi:Gfo/Idh/MocA family oxidoreductase [Shimia sp.]|uniref:Gfo/Idh/MocA family protein n=1 Tax=Shimia sp. TaxID=1954381 RepID=UPI003299FD90